jgi:hypothetical protein
MSIRFCPSSIKEGIRQVKSINHFAPRLISKIGQSLFPVKLSFTKNSLLFSTEIEEIEYPDGKFIAHSFLRAGIVEITLKDFLSKEELRKLEELIHEAQVGKISNLIPDKLKEFSFVEKFQEAPINELSAIPGAYKHYTNYRNYCKIMAEMQIAAMPHPKNGEIKEGIYLTGLSLSPQEAYELIFIRNPEYQNRATHVISFDIKDPNLEKEIKKNGIEYFFQGKISLQDPRIELRYHGPNFIREAI